MAQRNIQFSGIKLARCQQRYSLIVLIVMAVFWGVPLKSYGHSYMDFSVSDMWLDKECHLNVAIKNIGGTLPDHFYYTTEPAVLKINKGSDTETTASFTRLDSEQKLASDQQVLIIKSTGVYANNDAPVTVAIQYGSEFGDYNQRNDSLTHAIDCRIGEGQIKGKAIVYDAPDIAIEGASISPESCTLKLALSNKTGVALDAAAWAEKGVVVMLKNADTGERFHSVPLTTLDPKHQFTRSTQQLQWKGDFAIRQSRIGVAIWYVTGDSDFSNNEKIIEAPVSCLAATAVIK